MIDIEANKLKFISLLREIDRPNSDIEGLISHLLETDFFVAPCSTKFHLAEDGGLCQHSLNVYEEFNKLCDIYAPNTSKSSRIVLPTCHDLSKEDYYDAYFKNVKDYVQDGKFSDERGRFNWKSEKSYSIKDAEERFLLGHHGHNSEYIVSSYIPLSVEESAAIINHMGGVMDEYKPWDATPIYNRFPLAALLHMADFIATYLVENKK